MPSVSGTTTVNRVFPMLVDGREIYRLIDTPGFQRARTALEWMHQHAASASEHRIAVERFIEAHRDDPRYEAECQLLEPILAGAGILYVIDGSIPYGPEYDAEMEILRWTGQPSMALINQIGESEYFDQWQQPLSQYFKIVRVFDAQQASFDRQVQLLTGFSELADEWRQPLQEAASMLRAQRAEQIVLCSRLIADMVGDICSRTERYPMPKTDEQEAIVGAVKRFQRQLVALEQETRAEIETLFHYSELERNEASLAVLSSDLFSEQTWSLFGLTRDQLVTAGIVGGAAGGALLDIGSGGLTMFLGSGLGAVVGGAGAWFGSKQMIKARVLGLPLGGRQLVVGPVTNPNFPWVLLGRAVVHLQHLCRRTHARRDPMVINHEEDADRQDIESNRLSIVHSLNPADRKSLQAMFTPPVPRRRAERTGTGKTRRDCTQADQRRRVTLPSSELELLKWRNS